MVAREPERTAALRICVNRAKTRGVKESRTVAVDTGPSVSGERFDAGGGWRDPPAPFSDAVDNRLDNRALVAAVHDAIAELTDPQRAVVTLRDVEGQSTEEVAQLLGLSVANVRVILFRARARVRGIVEEAMKGSTT